MQMINEWGEEVLEVHQGQSGDPSDPWNVTVVGGFPPLTVSFSGPTGSPVPSEAAYIGGSGYDLGPDILNPVRVDTDGNVFAVSLGLDVGFGVFGAFTGSSLFSYNAQFCEDVNMGLWFGSDAPTVGQKAMVDSLPVVISSDQTAIPVSQSGAWSIAVTGTVAVTQSTDPWLVAGKSADDSANTTAKLPVLPARANAAAPTWTENRQEPLSVDLSGSLRSVLYDVTSGGPVRAENNLTTNIGTRVSLDVNSFTRGMNVGGATWDQIYTDGAGGLQVYMSDGINKMPMMDDMSRAGYVYLTDGAQVAGFDGVGNLVVVLHDAAGSDIGSVVDSQDMNLGGTALRVGGLDLVTNNEYGIRVRDLSFKKCLRLAILSGNTTAAIGVGDVTNIPTNANVAYLLGGTEESTRILGVDAATRTITVEGVNASFHTHILIDSLAGLGPQDGEISAMAVVPTAPVVWNKSKGRNEILSKGRDVEENSLPVVLPSSQISVLNKTLSEILKEIVFIREILAE